MIVLLLAWCGGVAAGAAALAPAAAVPLLGGAVLLALGGAGTVFVSQPGRHFAAVLLAPAVLLAGAARGSAAVHVVSPGTIDYYQGRHLSVSGTVTRSSSSATFQSFWLSALSSGGRPLAGTIQVTSRSPVPVVPGSTVGATGTLERLPGRAYDGSTAYDDRMERQGVWAAMSGASFQVDAGPSMLSPRALAWRLRTAISASTRAQVREPEATILLGTTVGIRARLPAPVEADLVDSGLVHLLAVSGLKVAVVAGVLTALLRRVGRRAALLAIVGVFAYALVGGGSSAALRSAVMGSLGLVAQVLRRDTDSPRSLLLAAAAMVALNPELPSDLSFQYSFLGVAGIQLLHPALDARLRWLPHPFREALAVSVAAQAATLPLTAAYFHVVTVGGPLVNAVAVPFVGATMAAAAWVAASLPDPGGLVLLLAVGASRGLLLLAHLGAALPGFVLRVPWVGLPHALAYYVSALTLVAAVRLRAGVAGVAAGLVLGVSLLAALSLPDGQVHLAFMDTPGGGVLVTAPDGARMLLDTGSSAPALAAALDGLLAPPDPRLDAVLLTGSSPGAARGADALAGRRPGLLLVAANSPGDAPDRLAASLAAAGVAVRVIDAGNTVRWHGLDLELDRCGPGLAVTVRFGQAAWWVCDSAQKNDPGAVPVEAPSVADVGEGRFEPDGSVAGATWVVIHGSRAGPGGLSAAALGPRLWRTARDGPLVLTCDRVSCHE